MASVVMRVPKACTINGVDLTAGNYPGKRTPRVDASSPGGFAEPVCILVLDRYPFELVVTDYVKKGEIMVVG